MVEKKLVEMDQAKIKEDKGVRNDLAKCMEGSGRTYLTQCGMGFATNKNICDAQKEKCKRCLEALDSNDVEYGWPTPIDSAYASGG